MFERIVFDDREEEETAGAVVTKYICTTCGSSFCSDIENDKKINTCLFCGSGTLTSEEYVESKKYQMIPFTIKIEEAKKKYRNKTLWNPLVPFSFKFRKNKPQVEKVYIPTLLVNATQSGIITFLGGEKEKVVKDKKKVTELKKYEVVQEIHVDYDNVLLNASSKIDDKTFLNVCHYNYQNLEAFDEKVLSDASYLIEDIPVGDIGDRGRDKMIKHTLSLTRDNVSHSLKKLKEDQSTFAFHDAKEVLVPVFLLSIPYRKKIYQFFMNGEDGKCYFHLPVGILSTCIFSIVICAIIFVIAYFVAMYV